MSLFVMELPNSFTNTQQITGGGFDYGRTVQLQTSDGTPVGAPAVVGSDGRFTVTLDDAHRFHASGDQLTVYVAETDASGQSGISYFPETITYNTVPPVITIAQGNGEVDPSHVTLSGTIVAAHGADRTAGSILIYDGDVLVGGGGVERDGTWSATAYLFGTGHIHQLTARTDDAAGNYASSAPVTVTTDLFGHYSYDPHSSVGQVYALYDGLLGRTPDPLGFESWTDQVSHGASLASVTAAFLASAEGQARLGAASNADFVQQLYQNTLHRAPDTAGFSGWVSRLDHGASRVDVADGFVFSSEHLANLNPIFDAGVYVADAHTSDVALLYYAMLGRAPDANGLQAWTAQLNQGAPIKGIAQGLLNSAESQALYGGLSNSDYVDQVYMNALGRHAESAGLAGWTAQLDHGASRADVAVGVAESPEAHAFHLSQIEQGWHLA